MWRSASSTERAFRFAAALALVALAATGPARAAELASLEDALRRAFPPPAVTSKRTLYLDEGAAASVSEMAGSPLPSRIVTCYEARARDAAKAPVVGWACLDTHIVRTLPETLLVVVGADHRVRRVEVLAFKEPRDYLLPEQFLEQFEERPLDEELALKRGIRVVSGATLSSRAATRATRRVLALVALELDDSGEVE